MGSHTQSHITVYVRSCINCVMTLMHRLIANHWGTCTLCKQHMTINVNTRLCPARALCWCLISKLEYNKMYKELRKMRKNGSFGVLIVARPQKGNYIRMMSVHTETHTYIRMYTKGLTIIPSVIQGHHRFLSYFLILELQNKHTIQV